VLDTQKVLLSSDHEMHCLCVVSSSLHIWYSEGRNNLVLAPPLAPPAAAEAAAAAFDWEAAAAAAAPGDSDEGSRCFAGLVSTGSDALLLSELSDERMAASTIAAWSGSATCDRFGGSMGRGGWSNASEPRRLQQY
jgi:hypothetical protein